MTQQNQSPPQILHASYQSQSLWEEEAKEKGKKAQEKKLKISHNKVEPFFSLLVTIYRTRMRKE
jgi:hypothetical protein